LQNLKHTRPKATSLLFCLALFSLNTQAVEHFVEAQSGSMQGALHLSYGLTFAKKHHLSMGVGFVPELDNHEEMTITSIKYRYEGETRIPVALFNKPVEISPINFGITSISGHQDEIHRKNPEYLPSGYYMPTARRVLFNYQTILKFDQTTEAYVDWTILDVGLINYVRNFEFYKDNYDYLGLEGVVSYGFGLRKKF